MAAGDGPLREDGAPPRPKRRHEDASWAGLMKHSFGLDVLGCRRCGARMRLVAVIHDRKEVRRLLQNLRVWSDLLTAAEGRLRPCQATGKMTPERQEN